MISMFSFSITNQAIVNVVTLEGFDFSNKLVTGTEISWILTKYDVTPETTADQYAFTITDEKNMSEGDIFHINFLQNLNDLDLDYFGDLYYTEEQWGEYYLNGVSIGKNASEIYWYGPDYYGSVVLTIPILPITLQLSTGSENYFDYIYDIFTSLPDNETEDITMENTESIFSIKVEYHDSAVLFFGSSKIDYELEVVYNKEWGVLAKYDLYKKVSGDLSNSEVNILYETEVEDIKVAPFSWTSSFIAIFIVGIVILVKRRKKQRLK